jgi:dipeptidase D
MKKLMALAKDVYLQQNGEEINVVAVHAGLECGTFKVRNPALDMISIGPDLRDVHTTKETFYMAHSPGSGACWKACSPGCEN